MSYHNSLVHCRTGHGLHLCGAHNLSMRGWERATSLARGTLAHIALLILIQHIVYICEYWHWCQHVCQCMLVTLTTTSDAHMICHNSTESWFDTTVGHWISLKFIAHSSDMIFPFVTAASGLWQDGWTDAPPYSPVCRRDPGLMLADDKLVT